MNYLILALTAYKATAEVIFDRLVNVTIVCQVIKRTLKSQKLNWSHQAIFNFLRSATNIFLMQTLGEFHKLKSDMLEKEEHIVRNIDRDNPDKNTQNHKMVCV